MRTGEEQVCERERLGEHWVVLAGLMTDPPTNKKKTKNPLRDTKFHLSQSSQKSDEEVSKSNARTVKLDCLL